MRLLLDTHAVFWALTDPDHIPKATRDLVTDQTVTVLVSPVSAYEMAHKHRLGNMPQATALLPRFEQHIKDMGATALPLATNHALVAGQLAWPHRDPFDRLLAAQAICDNCHLVSLDPAFATLPGLMTLW